MSERKGKAEEYLIVDNLLDGLNELDDLNSLLDVLDNIDQSKCEALPEYHCIRFSMKGKINSEGALMLE